MHQQTFACLLAACPDDKHKKEKGDMLQLVWPQNNFVDYFAFATNKLLFSVRSIGYFLFHIRPCDLTHRNGNKKLYKNRH
jgi:hypothetical protein